MKKILIVEDDELISDLEKDYLEVSNYQVDIAEDGEKGMKLAKERQYDLLLLDVMLPKINGYEICREIRKDSDVPIIMVTAKREDVDKIKGLGLGADDYIVKPFSPSELVARIRAHISIHERLLQHAGEKKAENELYQVNDLKIDTLSHRVYIRDTEISLANKEYELLTFLARNPNVVFSKEQLFDRVWGFDAVGDVSTVTVHINRIREKIEKDMSNPEYIETVWGAGYRFCRQEGNNYEKQDN